MQAREQRETELVELVAGIVEVVLAVHFGTLRREQVRDRVADRDPSPAARVQRAGGVGGDELEVDPLPAQRLRASVAVAGRDGLAQHIVGPRRIELEIDESGPRDVDFNHMSRSGAPERVTDLRRHLPRREIDRSLELERDRGREITLITVFRDVEAHARGRFGKPGATQSGAHSG